MSLGFTEILLIIGVVLLLFGAKKIPDLARALGRASYEFKKAKSALEEESKELIASAEKNAELTDQQDAEKIDSETRS